jgi:hypothetical protein
MKRKTGKERGEELAEVEALRTRYVDEKGLSIYFSAFSSKTFANLRGQTPKYWSVEQIKKALAEGKLIPPPYKEIGGKRVYDLREFDEWVALYPTWGVLPDMKETDGAATRSAGVSR